MRFAAAKPRLRAGADIADDLAAQTFTLAFAHRGRYRDDLSTARPWLLGIATNLLREQARRERRDRPLAHLSRLRRTPTRRAPGLPARDVVQRLDD